MAIPGFPRQRSPAADAHSFRSWRIEQAARKVARSGHDAEGDQFPAGNAVVDEMPVKWLFHQLAAQICKLRFGEMALRSEARISREKFERRFHGSRVVEREILTFCSKYQRARQQAASASDAEVDGSR